MTSLSPIDHNVETLPGAKDHILRKGVQINLEAIGGPTSTNEFKAFTTTSPDFDKAAPIQISGLVGLPLLAKMTTEGPKDDTIKAGNSRGAALLVTTDVKSKAFGRVGDEWAGVKGVQVVREDGKDLLVQHIEVLCAYCKEDLGPAFEFSLEMEDDEVLREDVLGLISKERFVGFWEMYKAKQSKREGWNDMKDPFQM